MNAMVEKFLHIAQGRFGARAMRGILEGSLITSSQQVGILFNHVLNKWYLLNMSVDLHCRCIATKRSFLGYPCQRCAVDIMAH